MNRHFINITLEPSQSTDFFRKASLLMKTLHWGFASFKANTYVVDVPGAGTGRAFRLVRVFSDSIGALEKLIDKITPMLDPSANIVYDAQDEHAVFSVHESFDGPWVALKRIQLPTRRSFNQLPPGTYNRAARLREIEQSGLSFFYLQSNTNKHWARIYIDRMAMEAPTENKKTNTLGLSSRFNLVAMPDLGSRIINV